MPEDLFEFEVVYDNPEANIQICESIDAYEIIDRYVPNRHALLFKEFLYVLYINTGWRYSTRFTRY